MKKEVSKNARVLCKLTRFQTDQHCEGWAIASHNIHLTINSRLHACLIKVERRSLGNSILTASPLYLGGCDPRQPGCLYQGQILPDQPSGLLWWSDTAVDKALEGPMQVFIK